MGEPAIAAPDFDTGRLAQCGSLAELRDLLAALPPPVIVFNKSHSGSRLVAELLARAGIFMGARTNESGDAVALLPFIEACVEGYYPDFSTVIDGSPADAALAATLAAGLARHLAGYVSGPWGWKLCETVYTLPVLQQVFPEARYIHLIRDGRDVGFANHEPPKLPFWQKIYADAVGIGYWNGLFFGPHARTFYRLWPHRYNVQHWLNSVRLGRRYGAMLGARYIETRYETLCRDFAAEAHRLCGFARGPAVESAIAALAPRVTTSQIGRYRREAWWKQRAVIARARPLLVELGYIEARR